LWQIQLAVLLVMLTVGFYFIRWQLFPTPVEHREMLRYILGDIAFLFLQVLLVTVFIDGVTQYRAREEMRQKLNMVVGAFFSQTGTHLLRTISGLDTSLEQSRNLVVAHAAWTPVQYRLARQTFSSRAISVSVETPVLVALLGALSEQKSYILGLLGNQSLLEHQHFSDLLWALTHLAEELEARDSLDDLTRTDRAHLAGDIIRAYALLADQWLDYLAHLSSNYPYLYSLALRTNPLDPGAHAALSDPVES
jgi:hypothetical protein